MLQRIDKLLRVIFSIKVKVQEQNKKVQNASRADIGKVGDRKIENLSKAKINRASKTDFLTTETKIAFFSLQKVFTKVPIFYHLDSESWI